VTGDIRYILLFPLSPILLLGDRSMRRFSHFSNCLGLENQGDFHSFDNRDNGQNYQKSQRKGDASLSPAQIRQKKRKIKKKKNLWNTKIGPLV